MHSILMIEDDLEFAEIMVECLGADPEFTVTRAFTNQLDASVAFRSGMLRGIDAVLVDLHLAYSTDDRRVNVSGGLKLICEMRQEHAFSGKIIVLTNSDSFEDGENALNAGCDGYLCKHVRMGDLPALLSELRMAIRGDVVLVSSRMRHIFMKTGGCGVDGQLGG